MPISPNVGVLPRSVARASSLSRCQLRIGDELNVDIIVAVILFENSCPGLVPNSQRARIEPFGDDLRAAARSRWNTSVICVGDEHIAGAGRVTRSREDGYLSRESCSGAAVASEHDDVSAVVGRWQIAENRVFAGGPDTRIQSNDES